MELPLISVIVPVYNAEKCLGRCAESILAQNYSALELILVDDGSTDRSPAICDDYASRDFRVRVVHKRNGGVSSARNAGLDAANGEFVAFIDSDDRVREMYLMNLYEGVGDVVDIVVSGCTVIRYGNEKKRTMQPCMAAGNDFDEIFEKNYIQTGPWAKLFRRSAIEKMKLRFREDIQMGEDALFVFSFISRARGISVVEGTGYLYDNEPNPEALTQKFYPVEKEMLISSLVEQAVDTLAEGRNIRSPRALTNLNDVKCIYRNRVLNSIYATRLPASRRIGLLRKIDTDKMWLYSLRKDGLKPWLLSRCLRCGFLKTYDFLRISAKKR